MVSKGKVFYDCHYYCYQYQRTCTTECTGTGGELEEGRRMPLGLGLAVYLIHRGETERREEGGGELEEGRNKIGEGRV